MESHSSSSSSQTYMESPQTSKQTLPYYSSSLHSVRKAPAKPWKKPVAPLPPTPPRVYKVDPVNFRDLVQKLTAAPEFVESRRLRTMAPPPVEIETPPLHRPSPEKAMLSHMYKEFSEVLEKRPLQKGSEVVTTPNNFLGLNLSPSSYNWCSFPLLSPGTMSSLENSTVL